MNNEDWIGALAETASAWRDPEHPSRQEAVRQTLDAPNRFTEEALAFALNHAMHQCTRERLTSWARPAPVPASQPLTVGVLHDGAVPLDGFRHLIAVLIAGHRYVGAVAESSPYLLPALLEDLEQRLPELPATFADKETVYAEADALIATAREDEVAARCEEEGIRPERRWLRSPDWSVAVLDGSESEDEREGLAEDAWLYDGHGGASVRIIWAPRDLSPDPYLEAMAQFRGVFPAHEDTPGALAMQRAMLEARDQAHAYADGLVFLMSKGAPDPQLPGHLRWAEYDELAQVEKWIRQRADDIQHVAARGQLSERINLDRPVRAPGTLHRAMLDEGTDDADMLQFLAALAETEGER